MLRVRVVLLLAVVVVLAASHFAWGQSSPVEVTNWPATQPVSFDRVEDPYIHLPSVAGGFCAAFALWGVSFPAGYIFDFVRKLFF